MPDKKKMKRMEEIGSDLKRIAENIDDESIATQLMEYGDELVGLMAPYQTETMDSEEEESEESEMGKESPMSDKLATAHLKKSVKL